MLSTSPSIVNISAALFAFQGAVEGVERNSKNPAFKSRYANLEAVRDTAVPELQKVGVVFIQSAGAIVEGVMAMTTRLIHVESGEWIEGTMDIALGKRDPQGVGSASTYAARYSLMHMLGLPPIDDDGEGAIDRNNSRPEPAPFPGDIEAPATGRAKYSGHGPTLPKAKTRDLYAEMQAEIDACATMDELGILWRSHAFQASLLTLAPDWQDEMKARKETRKTELSTPPKNLGEQLDRMEREGARR